MKKIIVLTMVLVVSALLCSCGQTADIMNSANTDAAQVYVEVGDSVCVQLDSEDFIGKNIDEIVTEFENAGFTQIKKIAIDDLTREEASLEGSIVDISINGSKQFEAEQVFSKQSLIEIAYRRVLRIPFPIDVETVGETAYIELFEQLAKAGYTNIETDEQYDQKDTSKTVIYVGEGQKINKGDEIPYDTKIQLVGHYPVKEHNITIAIDFRDNWFFSRYGVTVFFDGDELVKLAHGEDKSLTIAAPKGSYKLKFVSQEDSKIVTEVELQISDDMNFAYGVHCHSDNIEITEKEAKVINQLKNDEIRICYSGNYYLGKEKDICVQSLKEQGFANITLQPVEDILWGRTHTGRVTSVSIAGKTEYSYGDIFSGKAAVIVKYHVPSVEFASTEISITEGDAFTLEHSLSEQDFEEDVTIKVADDTVLKMNSQTEFEALKPGTTEILAIAGDDCVAKCTVVVEKLIIPISSISFASPEVTVSVGAFFELEYSYKPENANYTDVVAAISTAFIEKAEDGKFYANKAGTTQITLSQTGKELGTVTVHSVDIPVETMTMEQENIAVNIGKTKTLNFSLQPANATGITLDMQVANSKIATVSYDKKGPMQFSVSGVAKGTTKLLVKADGVLLLEKEIKVEEILPDKISISTKNSKIYDGASGKFEVAFQPADVSSKVVKWKSDAPKILKIDNSGAYTAVAPGKATITATHACGLVANLAVEVLPVEVKTVKVVSDWDSEKAFTKGKKMTLKAVVLPENATDKAVTWESSDKSVVTVSSKGVVTAVFAGKATITARSKNGVTAHFDIMVEPSPQKFKVTYTLTKKSTNHVGNSWSKGFEFNDEKLKSGKTVSIMPGETFTIRGWAMEKDTNPDEGEYYKEFTLTDEICKKGFTIKEDFYVRENQGRYSGCEARWQLKVTFKPVN